MKRVRSALIGWFCVGSVACGEDGGGVTPGGTTGECDFSIDASLSPQIATVGIVEWDAALPGITSAEIEFGLDTTYGLRAPVELATPGYRTLLLGMKPTRVYHYRIVARGPERTCTSEDRTLTTGDVPNGLASVTASSPLPDVASGGFLLTGFLATGPAFVLDQDGEYVWWYGEGDMGRVALSRDRKHVWYASINVAGKDASMRRVSLDGLEESDLSAEFGEIHHDFTLLPDETIAFIEHQGDTDRVMERAPDGTLSEVFDVSKVQGGVPRNHTNSIHYAAEDDSYTVSDLSENAFVKVTRGGEVVWVFGGEHSDFSGTGTEWHLQHGHQPLGPDGLLFFSNGEAGEPSRAIEVKLDLETHEATRVWEYASGIHTLLYGDVQRLPNGNTLVSFSASGIVHEVTPEGELVREFAWQLGGALGYTTLLSSLYAPHD